MNSLGIYMMLNQMVLCFDVLGSIVELGFLSSLIVEVLTINKGVEFYCFPFKYSSIFKGYTISFISSMPTTYSSFVVDSTGTDCLRDLQETIVDPRLIVYLETNTHVSLSPSKY